MNLQLIPRCNLVNDTVGDIQYDWKINQPTGIEEYSSFMYRSSADKNIKDCAISSANMFLTRKNNCYI